MRSPDQVCAEDRVARAHRGSLSPTEAEAFAHHLARCPDCRMARQLRLDFERSAAPEPGDELRLERAIKLAMGSVDRGFRDPRRPRLRMGVVAAVTLLVAGVASGAILIHHRLHTDAVPPTEAGGSEGNPRRASASARRAALPPTMPPPPALPLMGSPAPADPVRPTAAAPPPPVRATRGRVKGAAVGPGPGALPLASAPDPVDEAAALFVQAVDERDQGRPDQALTLFRSLQRRFPRSPQALLSWASLADLSLDAGDAASALAAFDTYLQADPAGALGPEALQGKARALARLGRSAEAEEIQRELVRRYPHAPYSGTTRVNTPAKDPK